MKWDFAIGNPPYQQETENISLTNGQLRSKSVFHFFKLKQIKLQGSLPCLSTLPEDGYNGQVKEWHRSG